jgi:DNA polymerase II large subunit
MIFHPGIVNRLRYFRLYNEKTIFEVSIDGQRGNLHRFFRLEIQCIPIEDKLGNIG